MNKTKNLIKYNGQYIPDPIPLVSFEKELSINESLDSAKEIIKLNGTITGSFEAIKNDQINILNIFNSNFKKFEIYESGETLEKIYERSNVIIDKIEFNKSNYNGIVEYNIDLYNKTAIENVIEKKDEFSFNLENDYVLNVKHNISAKGLNTNGSFNKSNALNNAISYVNSLTGLNHIPNLNFINLKNNNFYLKDKREVIDRVNAVYSIEESYVNDASNYANSSGILRYTFNIESGNKNNFLTFKLNGSFEGSNGQSIDSLRNSLNITGIVSSVYSSYYNPIPIEYSIDENVQQSKINFNYTFDSINLPNPYVTYSINKKYDDIYETTEVSIKANIKARGNEIARISACSNLIEELNLSNIASKFSGNYTLYLVSKKETISASEGIFEVSAIYSDRKPINEMKISYSPVFKYVKPQKSCNGTWVFQDFNIKTLGKVNASFSYPSTDPAIQVNNLATQIIKENTAVVDNGKIKKYQLEGYSSEEYNIEP